MQRFLVLLCSLFIFNSLVFSDDLTDGYAAFIKNDTKSAYQHFLSATTQKESKAEAYLMLSLMSSVYKDQPTAFNYFLEFYKNTSDPEPYIMALFKHKSVFGYSSLKSASQLAWINELLQRPNLNSNLKAHLYEELAGYYETVQDLKKSRENLAKIGAVMPWKIVGDFDNVSGSGFNKNYAPISHPEPEAVFKNKMNADVKWFDLERKVPGKWIDFLNNFYCKNTLVYAQTFCNIAADQDVNLCIGTSGSLKLWINDQQLFSVEEERDNGIDTYVVPVKLFKGNNRILLQIACSKITRLNFMMRVTDRNGNLLSLPFTSDFSSYNKTSQELPALAPSKSEKFFLDQIAAHPDKISNYLVLANAYLSNDKIYEALGILHTAQKMAPNCSFITEQLVELYSRDNNKTLTSVNQEKLKLDDPDYPEVLNYIIDNDFETENYKDVRLNIEKKEKLYGENEDLFYYKKKLASAENKAEEYAALINKSYNMYQDNYNFVYDKYNFEKVIKQNQKSAIKVLRDYLKKYYNRSALETLTDEYFQSGQINEGIEVLKKQIEYNPFNDEYYKQLGLYYVQAGSYNTAKPYLEECLKIAPYYGPYYGNYAKIFEETGDKDKAIQQYKLNISYKPDDYEAIKKLRNLQGKPEVADYFANKDYYKLFDNSPTTSDYPDDNFISLTEETQSTVYENGGNESRYILMYKALTQKGIDNLKEFKIGYNSNESLNIEKAEVLKKNGNRLQAEIKDNQVVFTSLESGDAVFLIYKKSRTITDQLSKFFFEKDLLNKWYPVLHSEYNILVANSVKLNYRMDNSDMKPEITSKDDFKLYSWKKELSPAIKSESYMPSLVDIGELISVSTLPDWDYISKWYYDISNTKTQPDIEVKNTVDEILKDKGTLTEIQKAKLFYNFIVKNIRYSSVSFRQSGTVPQKASDVLVTRIGDCKDLSVLFTSMCNAVGIKAGIVLVLRHEDGVNWKNLPSFDFDHAIARAHLDGKDYYIELTSPYFPFSALGESHVGAVILDVNNDSTVKTSPVFLNPANRQPNNLIRVSTVSFDGDNMTNSISVKRTGVIASYTRSSYRELGKDEQIKKFTKSIAKDYSNTKLLKLNFDQNLNDCSDSVTYQYSYIAPKVFTKINNLNILKLPLTEKLSPMDFLSLEDRKFPIEQWKYDFCDTVIERVTIILPENKTLAEIPKSVKYSCNQQEYSLSFSMHGKNLFVERIMIYKNYEVPVSEYLAYRSFMESVVNADTQQIGFK